jgi:hypothetical protein
MSITAGGGWGGEKGNIHRRLKCSRAIRWKGKLLKSKWQSINRGTVYKNLIDYMKNIQMRHVGKLNCK